MLFRDFKNKPVCEKCRVTVGPVIAGDKYKPVAVTTVAPPAPAKTTFETEGTLLDLGRCQ